MTVNNYYYNNQKDSVVDNRDIVKRNLYKNNYMIYGNLIGDVDIPGPYLVTAFTSEYGKQELIDSYQMGEAGFYSLNLPQGSFFLYVFRDINRDYLFSSNECVGRYEGNSETITFATVDSSYSSVRKYDINLFKESESVNFDLSIQYVTKPILTKSSFYPMGTIRDIEDDIFSSKYGLMGMFEPEEFREHVELNFYALQEYAFFKQPILFIHGRKGAPGIFKDIVNNINQNHFQPWFFYYPSGGSANENVDILYEVLFSGDFLIKTLKRIVVITEGTGALLFKNVIKRSVAEGKRNKIAALITIGAPFNGEIIDTSEYYTRGELRASLYDLAEESMFIKSLYSMNIDYDFDHHLIFNIDTTSFKNLKSQLHYKTQFLSTSLFGINGSSETILQSDTLIMKINKLLDGY